MLAIWQNQIGCHYFEGTHGDPWVTKAIRKGLIFFLQNSKFEFFFKNLNSLEFVKKICAEE